ncbi:MAG: diaminopimelate epimerase [Oscillospiraceae bacterium]
MKFTKMQGCGNDYVYVNCFNETIDDRPALSRLVSNRNFGVGSDGLICICPSQIADFKMDMYNADGSASPMCGNGIRCVGKYLFDRGIVPKTEMTIETASGVKSLKLYSFGGEVRSVRVNMGRAELHPEKIPIKLDGERIINRVVEISDGKYCINCVSMGNPHCVVFCGRVDRVDLPKLGPLFENDPLFPDRVNTEFVRIINRNTLKMRVWERGNGETPACGTGACAAVVAAVEMGLCAKGEDVTVKVRGGELIVNYTDEAVFLTGNAKLVFEGSVEF